MIRAAAQALRRNLAAGTRVALMLRVPKAAFRIDALQALLLALAGCVVDALGDFLAAGPASSFDPRALGTELGGVALVAVPAVLVAAWMRRRGAALAMLVVLLAAYPVMAAVRYAVYALAAFLPALREHYRLVYLAMLAWSTLVALRAVAIELGEPLRRRLVAVMLGGLVLAAPIVASEWVLAEYRWFRPAAEDGGGEATAGASAGGALSPASEPVLAAQADLLDDALSALEDHDSGASNLYFVGYAPDAGEPAWTAQLARVQKAVDARLDTRGRSVVLRNDRTTLLTLPWATVTNLRETFAEIAAASDPDSDIVIVYLAGQGARGGAIEGNLPPLELVPLTPAGLKSLLDDAGITWRVVVVSACHAGEFIDALADEHTVVITASSDGAAFGCEGRGEPALFGDALFGEGFARGDSLEDAFATAREAVARRERALGLPPSAPQMRIGEAIAPRVRHLKRPGRGITTAALRIQ